MPVETSEILAHYHRRVVEEFIESVLDELDLGDVERNVLGVAIRREVEVGLVLGIVAIQAVFHASDAGTLGKELPRWLERASSVMPEESEFMADMGRCLDPAGYDLMDENLGLRPGASEVGRAFENWMWEIAPTVNRPN